jgi:hypothetical protein
MRGRRRALRCRLDVALSVARREYCIDGLGVSDDLGRPYSSVQSMELRELTWEQIPSRFRFTQHGPYGAYCYIRDLQCNNGFRANNLCFYPPPLDSSNDYQELACNYTESHRMSLIPALAPIDVLR